MPSIRLTQLAIAKLKKPKTGRITYWDKMLPCFGLQITSNDARSWKAAYRVKRHLVIETLGSLQQIPKVDTARDMARSSMLKAKAGIHPVEERQRLRAEMEAAAERSISFQSTVERFIDRYARERQKPTTLAETRRVFDREILPRWGK